MQLPKGSKIESSDENHISTYRISLLRYTRSIILHLVGIIFVAIYFGIKITSSGSDMNTLIILSSILGLIALIDSFVILWIVFGKEVIIIDDEYLTIKNALSGIGFKRKFEIGKIKDIRINIKHQNSKRVKIRIFNLPALIGLNRGFVIFNYKGKDIKFGSSLNMEEANFFVEKIKEFVRKNNYYLK